MSSGYQERNFSNHPFNTPRSGKRFLIIVDASSAETTAILTQEYGDQKQVIWFTGKLLKPSETRYTITQIEMLSVVLSVNGGISCLSIRP